MAGNPQQNQAAWMPPGKPRRRVGRIIFWVLVAISVALVAAAIGVTAATMRQYWDPTAGMEKTLAPGDHIMVALGSNVRRGDIIAFHTPAEPALTSVKRVIGLPGDHVACCDARNRVTVNGKPLNETYIKLGDVPSTIKFNVGLGPGQIWVMGDNRTISLDSREFGPVAVSTIVGHAFAMGHRFPLTTLRTPPTFVADGLAPPDTRIPPYVYVAMLSSVGIVALIILAIIGITRFIIRRSRARRHPPILYPTFGTPPH
jgi:signal peptidase I